MIKSRDQEVEDVRLALQLDSCWGHRLDHGDSREEAGWGWEDHEFLPKKLQVPREQQVERWRRQFDMKV